MKIMVDEIQSSDESDGVRWMIGNTGHFCVRNQYSQLRSHRVFPFKFMWKLKISTKSKGFHVAGAEE